MRNGRPARSGRASSRSRREPNARRSVSSFPTASGNSSASTSSAGGRRPRTRALCPAARERPGLPCPPGRAALRPLPQAAPPAPPSGAPPVPRAPRSGRPGAAAARAAAVRGSPPPCRPRRRVPARDARRSPPRVRRTGAAQRPRVGPRQLRRRRAPARAPPPSLRTAARRPSSRSRRVPAPRARPRSRSPRAAAAPPPTPARPLAGSCSTSTSCGHIASASPSRIPGCTPASSAAAVTGPTSGSVPGYGRERRRHERQPRLLPQRRTQLETWDEETRDHGNVCSIPEQVFLSNRRALGRSPRRDDDHFGTGSSPAGRDLRPARPARCEGRPELGRVRFAGRHRRRRDRLRRNHRSARDPGRRAEAALPDDLPARCFVGHAPRDPRYGDPPAFLRRARDPGARPRRLPRRAADDAGGRGDRGAVLGRPPRAGVELRSCRDRRGTRSGRDDRDRLAQRDRTGARSSSGTHCRRSALPVADREHSARHLHEQRRGAVHVALHEPAGRVAARLHAGGVGGAARARARRHPPRRPQRVRALARDARERSVSTRC